MKRRPQSSRGTARPAGTRAAPAALRAAPPATRAAPSALRAAPSATPPRRRRQLRRKGWPFQGPWPFPSMPYVFASPAEEPPVPASPDAQSAAEPPGQDDAGPTTDDASDAGTATDDPSDAPDAPADQEAAPTPIAGGTTTITWQRYEATRYPLGSVPAGGGVYIVVDASGLPTYVGETSNFAERWRGRMREAYQAGRVHPSMRAPLVIWFGHFRQSQSETTRVAVQWAINRTLVNGGLGPPRLRNVRHVKHFTPSTRLRIVGVLPGALSKRLLPIGKIERYAHGVILRVIANNVVDVAANNVFELEFYDDNGRRVSREQGR